MAKFEKLYYTNRIETCVNIQKASWDVLCETLGNSTSDRIKSDFFIDGNTCNDDGIKAIHANEYFHNF